MYNFSDLQTLKFQRGQVWIVREDERLTECKLNLKTPIIARTRPYLIVSSNEFTCERIIYAIPLTHTVDVDRTDDIIVATSKTPNGLEVCSRIIMNQLCAIDSHMCERYMFTLPDTVMAKVSEIISYKLGLCSHKETAVTNLDDKTTINAKEPSTEPDDTHASSKPTTSKRHKWSDDALLELLIDSEKIKNKDKLAKKYNLSKVTITNLLYKARKIFDRKDI